MVRKATVNKKVGGMKRAAKAREFMQSVMADSTHAMHYAKDIDFARMFDVSRHTVYKIRHDLQIPDRLERVVGCLKRMDTSRYTIWELCSMLNIKYAGLYKILNELKLPYKSGLKPSLSEKFRRIKV